MRFALRRHAALRRFAFRVPDFIARQRLTAFARLTQVVRRLPVRRRHFAGILAPGEDVPGGCVAGPPGAGSPAGTLTDSHVSASTTSAASAVTVSAPNWHETESV